MELSRSLSNQGLKLSRTQSYQVWNYLGHSYQGVELFRAQSYQGVELFRAQSYQGVELFRAQLSRCGII